jgi:hypothetical protein
MAYASVRLKIRSMSYSRYFTIPTPIAAGSMAAPRSAASWTACAACEE